MRGQLNEWSVKIGSMKLNSLVNRCLVLEIEQHQASKRGQMAYSKQSVGTLLLGKQLSV